MQNTFDLIVVGGGAAGLTAALFAARRGLSTLVLTADIGGQASTAVDVANYPGVKMIEGTKLMEIFAEQVRQSGVKIIFHKATSIRKVNDIFHLTAGSTEYLASAVILAFGKTPNGLNLPNIEKFQKQVWHCLPENHTLYDKSEIAVIGSGNSAAMYVLALSKIAKKVYLVSRSDKIKCEEALQKKIFQKKNIEVVYNHTVTNLLGDKKLSQITVSNGEEEKNIDVSGVIVAIGYGNQTEWVEKIVALDETGQIIIKNDCSTSTPGVFAAGDVTTIDYKQVVISAGEGAKAAISVQNYLAQKQGKVASTIDWGKGK